MPYKSDAQRRFFHTEAAKKHGITPEMVAEFDAATRGKKLPERTKQAALAFEFGMKLAVVGSAFNVGAANSMVAPNTNNGAKSGAKELPKPLLNGKGAFNIKPPPMPGDTLGGMLDNVSNSSFAGPDSRLERGEALKMPIH